MGIGQIKELNTTHGFVCADMQIGGIFIQLPAGKIRHLLILIGLTAGHHINLAISLSVIHAALTPATSDGVIG